ncbi:MAG: glycoside hydrolase family 16 protein [Planctomycetota bacterium]
MFRRLVASSVLLAFASLAHAEPPGVDWRLVWADEFDIDGRPDPAKWGFERGFVRNRELQWYQPENAWVEGGNLVIEGRRERKRVDASASHPESRRRRVAEYTSASLKTKGKFTWRYGRMEVRAKIPAEPGMWPAIWTLGERGRWPSNGEVDLMEFYRGMILANAAHRGPDGKIVWDAVRVPIEEFGDGWADDFHTWRMDWNADRMELSVDGRVLNTTDYANLEYRGDVHPFRQPHYVLLNLAIGGINGGDPTDTPMPQRYLVDYVRVYEPAKED